MDIVQDLYRKYKRNIAFMTFLWYTYE